MLVLLELAVSVSLELNSKRSMMSLELEALEVVYGVDVYFVLPLPQSFDTVYSDL